MKIFLSITEAARVTGLSTYYLRQGVKSGEIEHLRAGEKYLVNMPNLLSKLGVDCANLFKEVHDE